MRKACTRALAGLLVAGALAATPAHADNIAFTVGTGGVSADWTVAVAERVQTRVHLSYLKLEADEESEVAPEDERQAMLDRLDAVLVVPPEYEIQSEEEGSGQFEDAEEDDHLL